MLTLQGISYTHPNKDILFSGIDLSVHRGERIALIGHNGAGKSTLLQVMAGVLKPSSGQVIVDQRPYYLPQMTGDLISQPIAAALGADDKLRALRALLDGQGSEKDLLVLDDDWDLEERCQEALAHWGIGHLGLDRLMGSLSGGQQTKVFLAGLMVHRPAVVLLDEPSNHLDADSRALLYEFIRDFQEVLVVVSHDRALLDLVDKVCELGKDGLSVYGGNYQHYVERKAVEDEAMQQELKSKEKALRKARETERKAMERQQKLDARGKKKQTSEGLPTISMNTFRNNAEKSTARMKGVHAEKVGALSGELDQLRKELPDADKMKMGLDDTSLHKGRVLIKAKGINFGYDGGLLWNTGLDLQINSGDRIALKGPNGAGKTTMIRMLLGSLEPTAGVIERAECLSFYIDQDYSFLDDSLTVYQQAQQYNPGTMEEHEIKSRLNRFLFTKDHWDRHCGALSGGERMRLLLCVLSIGNAAPDIIVLDEPTNNLDIQNIAILTAAINEYEGTIVVVSHDAVFLEEIGVEGEIVLQDRKFPS